MKDIEPLITAIYETLSGFEDLNLGSFGNSNLKAIAYNSVPLEYDLPPKDQTYIVYSFDSISAKPSETRPVLQDVVLKLYIGGNDNYRVADLIRIHLDRNYLYNYYVSYAGIVNLQSGDLTLRFTLI